MSGSVSTFIFVFLSFGSGKGGAIFRKLASEFFVVLVRYRHMVEDKLHVVTLSSKRLDELRLHRVGGCALIFV